MKLLPLALLVLLLSGFTACATTPPSPSQQQAIAAACASIAAAEDGLTALNQAGKLSKAEYDAVAKAIAVKAPICNVSPIPTSLNAAAFQELNSAVSVLVAIKGAH